MKKSLIFASIACAGAFALHADWTCQDWFKGIGDSVTPSNPFQWSDLNPVNGGWAAVPASGSESVSGTYSYDGGLVFDLEENESVAFTVGDGPAPDTNTVTDVLVSGVFTPVSESDLPVDSVMNDRDAQVGFVVGVNGTTTNFYAWTGDGWYTLTKAGVVDAGVDADQEKKLLVRFNYTTTPSTAAFAILTGTAPVVTNFLVDATNSETSNLTATASSTRRYVSGVSCYGSGKIVAANGAVGLGVASIGTGAGEVKYGSLADAVTGAGISEATINVLRETSENVSLGENSHVTINDPAENIKGTVTVNENATVTVAAAAEELGEDITNGVYRIDLKTHGGTVVVTLPSSVSQYKEILTTNVVEDQYIDVTLQTSSAIMNTLAAGGKTLNHDIAKLRTFLADYTNAAYTASNADKTLLDGALATPGGNGIPLWQSYELGVAPTDSIAPVATPAADLDTGNVTLAIPTIDTSKRGGDFTPKYKVGDAEATTDASSIKVPVPAAGSAVEKTVVITLE